MRKKTLCLLAGALILAAGNAQAAPKSPAAEIARITKDRTAGAPVNCILLRNIRSSEIVNRTAIVYHMNNGTIYVNRPDSGATFLDRGDVLVTDTHSPQLCNVDIVRLFDNGTRMSSGSVGLGQFVPYERPRRSASR